MLNKLFRSKIVNTKIDNSTAQILELETTKKRLEIDKEQISLELQNIKQKMDMQLEEEAHKQKLKLQEEKAVFEREKKVWVVEKEELLARGLREKTEFEDRLKKEYDLKIQEAVTLNKLESQQQIKQAELDKSREVNAIRTQSCEDVSNVRTQLAEEYYTRLTSAFQEIQLKGDANSKFVQELALKMFDKVPTSKSKFKVDVTGSATKQLAGTTTVLS